MQATGKVVKRRSLKSSILRTTINIVMGILVFISDLDSHLRQCLRIDANRVLPGIGEVLYGLKGIMTGAMIIMSGWKVTGKVNAMASTGSMDTGSGETIAGSGFRDDGPKK